jgi:hypothetical protein
MYSGKTKYYRLYLYSAKETLAAMYCSSGYEKITYLAVPITFVDELL